MIKTIQLTLTTLALSAFLISCTGGGGGSYKSDEWKKAEKLTALLSQGGTTYTLSKLHTKKAGFVVLQNMQTGEYVAYNMAKFDPKTMTTPDAYLANLNMDSDIVGSLEKITTTKTELETRYRTEYSTVTESNWEYVPQYDYNGNFTHYDYEYVSRTYQIETKVPYTEWVTNTYTTYERGNFVFEHNNQLAKDLELMGALALDNQVDELAGRLSERFGLSSSRSSDVARLIFSVSEVAKTRELTEADYKALYVDLLGADLKDFIAAKKEASAGQSTRLDQLIGNAAKLNALSPEQVRLIMTSMSELE